MKPRLSIPLWLAGLSTGLLLAQQPDPGRMALDLARLKGENDAAIKSFTWKSRLEFRRNGVVRQVIFQQVRYNLDGGLERILLDDGNEGKKMKKSEEWWLGVAEVARSYMHPSMGTLVDFFQTARFEPGTGKMEGTVRIRGAGFLRPDDSIRLWVDATSLEFRKMEFFTSLKKDPVNGAIEYRTHPDGVFYPALAYVQVPRRKVEAVAESFDLVRQP